MSQSFMKDPDATLDYRWDWSAWLPTGDTISTSTWIVPTGITMTDEQVAVDHTTIWLSGGTDGQTYDVVNRITTVQGRIDDRTAKFKVKQL